MQYNPLTQDYDGETQVVYYPQHTHSDGDHPQDLMNRIMERHSRSNYLSRNGNRKRLRTGSSPGRPAPASAAGGPGEADDDEDMEEEEEDMPQEEGEEGALAMDQYMKEFCQTQLEEAEVEGAALVVTSSAGPAHRQQQEQGQQKVILSEEAVFGEGGGQAVLVEGGEPGTYVVQEEDGEEGGQRSEEATEEYVLPADEDEWTKLFEVLRLRLMTSELTQQEKGDGEGLLSYQNVISYLPLAEQVTIFQQLCVLTNTAIATAD